MIASGLHQNGRRRFRGQPATKQVFSNTFPLVVYLLRRRSKLFKYELRHNQGHLAFS